MKKILLIWLLIYPTVIFGNYSIELTEKGKTEFIWHSMPKIYEIKNGIGDMFDNNHLTYWIIPIVNYKLMEYFEDKSSTFIHLKKNIIVDKIDILLNESVNSNVGFKLIFYKQTNIVNEISENLAFKTNVGLIFYKQTNIVNEISEKFVFETNVNNKSLYGTKYIFNFINKIEFSTLILHIDKDNLFTTNFQIGISEIEFYYKDQKYEVSNLEEFTKSYYKYWTKYAKDWLSGGKFDMEANPAVMQTFKKMGYDIQGYTIQMTYGHQYQQIPIEFTQGGKIFFYHKTNFQFITNEYAFKWENVRTEIGKWKVDDYSKIWIKIGTNDWKYAIYGAYTKLEGTDLAGMSYFRGEEDAIVPKYEYVEIEKPKSWIQKKWKIIVIILSSILALLGSLWVIIKNRVNKQKTHKSP